MYKGLVEYAIDLHLDSPEQMDLDTLREMLSMANLATGHDLSSSHQVWNVIKDFEVRLWTENHDEIQLKRLRMMWKQRLSTPHRQHAETWSAYSAFEQQVNSKSYESEMVAMKPSYNKGVEEFEEREAFDRRLLLDPSLWNVESYVEWEARKTKEFQRIIVVYERTLATNPLDASMWNSYMEYLLSHVKMSAILENVSSRAVRNCPWTADVWLHRANVTNDASTFTKALDNTHLVANVDELYKLVKGKAEWAMRNNQHAQAALQEGLGIMRNVSDPYSRYERFCARALSVLKDMSLARPIYEALVKSFPGESAVWMEYAMAEVDSGNVPKARTLMKQALVKKVDSHEVLFETWLAIEREHGSLDSLYEAIFRIRNRRRELHEKMAEAEVIPQFTQDAQFTKEAGTKRAAEDAIEPKRKKAKKGKNVQTDANSPSESTQEKPEAQEKPEDTTMQEAYREGPDPKTIYVSKLPTTITSPTLRILFAPFGQIKDVRLVKRPTTAFAYVEYETSEDAIKSLEMDGKKLEEKSINVRISNPSVSKGPKEKAYVPLRKRSTNVTDPILRKYSSRIYQEDTLLPTYQHSFPRLE